MGRKMRITYSIDKNEGFVIHIYITNTTKATEKSIVKKIPDVLEDLREQEKINKKLQNFMKVKGLNYEKIT
jgi:hypothetical protein